MSDLIRRSDALAAFAESTSAMPEKQGRRRIEEIPAVDAVEVVRCKECLHRFVDGDNVRFNECELNHNHVQSDDWFCSDGKRREDGDV